MKRITPDEAARLCQKGAVLIDIREADEHAREKIGGAVSLPMSSWDGGKLEAETVIYHCRSGNRTNFAADRLAAKAGGCDWYVLEGGIDAWKRAGLPVDADRKQPLELQRQVQLTAGLMIALGSLAGLVVSPWFHAVPAVVGVGLAYAGATGVCGLGRALAKAPWNRHLAAAAAS